MAFDDELAARTRRCFNPADNVVEKKMFGGLAFMYREYMCCGITGDRLMLRVPREEHGDYLQKEHVERMDFTGKSLKGFVYIDPEGTRSDADLEQWVATARETVEALPPK